MIISGMNTGIVTANVEENAKFYVDKLGFTIKHRLEMPGCKIYVMENEYTEFDLIEGGDFKPGTAAVRVTVRNFADSIQEVEEKGLKKFGEITETDRIKLVPYVNEDGTIVMISHHKKADFFV